MKIIYNCDQEVKMGDYIIYKAIKTRVTRELIDDNPHLFEVKDDKQELLEEVKKKFPVGTKFRNMGNGVTQTVIGEPYYHSIVNYIHVLAPKHEWSPYGNSNPTVYEDGRWAKRYLFTSEDGVDIFEGDYYWLIDSITSPCRKKKDSVEAWKPNEGDGLKRFSSEETAEKYLKSLKEKTLEDYENILLNNKCSATVWYLDNDISKPLILLSKGKFYETLRNNEPKLYWTKVLKLIADDLNDGWKSDWNYPGNKSYFIKKDDYYYTDWSSTDQYGNVSFKSKELADKAIKIMGDKLDFIFS